MSNLEPPELDFRARITRDWILPILPKGAVETKSIDGNQLEAAKAILAQEYVNQNDLRGLRNVLLILVTFDILFPLNPQLYGIILNIYGSVLLAVPALHTPRSLAVEVDTEQQLERQIRVSAKRSVRTNVGVAGLVLGFTFQATAVALNLGSDLLPTNYLQGVIAPIFVVLAILVALSYRARSG
jgi:hypothetical protein